MAKEERKRRGRESDLREGRRKEGGSKRERERMRRLTTRHSSHSLTQESKLPNRLLFFTLFLVLILTVSLFSQNEIIIDSLYRYAIFHS